jgi:hypothetical protein
VGASSVFTLHSLMKIEDDVYAVQSRFGELLDWLFGRPGNDCACSIVLDKFTEELCVHTL